MGRFTLTTRALSMIALLVLGSCRPRPVESPEGGETTESAHAEDVGQKLEATATTFAPGATRIELYHGEAIVSSGGEAPFRAPRPPGGLETNPNDLRAR